MNSELNMLNIDLLIMKLLLTFFLIFILTFQHSQDQAIETSTVTSQQE